MSKDININITNNQTNTSTINNSSSSNNGAAPGQIPPPISTPRRTIILLASNPTLAVTAGMDGTTAKLTPYEGTADQIFLTSFHVSDTSTIIPLISSSSVLTSDRDLSRDPSDDMMGLVVTLALSTLPPGRSILWTLNWGENSTTTLDKRLSLTPSNLQMVRLFMDDPIDEPVPVNLALDIAGDDFTILFLD